MRKNMLKSKETNGEKYNYLDYKYAKQVMTDFPALISLIDKLIPVLEEKAYYTGIANLLASSYDTKLLLEMQYDYYKKVYLKKGKTNNE